MKNIVIGFWAIITVLSFNTYAQIAANIKGKVYDVNSGSTLTSAMIYITDTETGKTDSTFTNSSGYWEYYYNPSAVNGSNILPGSFYVSQNYPNPFNPSTKVNVVIPEGGNVSAAIYDALGRLVDKREEFLQPGNYAIEWNARGSAGVYFLNIKTKTASVTRKMVLLDRCNGNGLSSFRSTGSLFSTAKSSASAALPNKVTFRATKFGYMPFTKDTIITGGENFDFRLETVHSNCIVADLHNDVIEVMSADPGYHLADFHLYNNTDIPRLKLGGVDLQIFSVWVSPTEFPGKLFEEAENMISKFQSELALNPNDIGQARTKQEAINLIEKKKIAGVIIVEGGHTIENDLNKLKTLYNQGMRYLTITWNNSTDWAVAAADSRSETVGLSEFGKSVIRMLDSLGVIIDVSHTGVKTIKDILTITKNPIIASHSGARALRNHYRNLTAEQIQAIAASGGVVGVVFYPPFLTSGTANITTVVNHIDYIVNLVGIDYVALGSDFDGIGTNTVSGLNDVSKFPAVTLELLKRGYTIEQVRKILGGNFLRVFEKVCGK